MRLKLLSGMFVLTGVASLALAAPALFPPAWDWAFPVGPPLSVTQDNVVKHHLPGSTLAVTDARSHDLTLAVDWYPDDHPEMPAAVADGGHKFACGFCHLPAGTGRPENSPLAGLSAEYIKEQVAAFADGSRKPARPDMPSTAMMIRAAKAATPEEIAAAATYYSKLRYAPRHSIIETVSIDTPEPFRFVYRLRPGAKQPIGDRIIEVPDNLDRFELRDPHLSYTAYVPPGSITAGKALVASGGPAAQPCAICHGEGLKGGIAPPLAGRYPTMLVRQLMGFKAGSRASDAAAPMRMVAEPLSEPQMIAIAAYVSSLKP